MSSLAGFGAARNRMGAMTYGFPSLSSTATTTPGGRSKANLQSHGVMLSLRYRF